MFHKETFHHLLSKPFSKLSLHLCLKSVSKVVGLFLVLSAVPLTYLSVASSLITIASEAFKSDLILLQPYLASPKLFWVFWVLSTSKRPFRVIFPISEPLGHTGSAYPLGENGHPNNIVSSNYAHTVASHLFRFSLTSPKSKYFMVLLLRFYILSSGIARDWKQSLRKLSRILLLRYKLQLQSFIRFITTYLIVLMLL